MSLHELILFIFAAANVPYVVAGDAQLQLSVPPLLDGVIDWANAGIDSFGSLSDGAQQLPLIDGFMDWINSMFDGSSPSATPTKPLPAA